jgi:ribosome-associated toxin RatA of RatAB toxin-antitoxin module
MAGASREIVVDAAPETVFGVVTDYEAYPQFIDEIVEAEILSRSARGVDCRFLAEIAKKRFQYTLRLEHTPFERTRWELIEGDFKQNSGGWDFRSLEGGRSTHVRYTVEIDLGMFIPKFVVNTLVGANMPKMLAAVKARAEAAGQRS